MIGREIRPTRIGMSLVWSGPVESWQKWLVRRRVVSAMEVTGETLLRVGKGELKGLLASMTLGQGWIQRSGQSLSSLVRFSSFCSHRKKPKTMLLCWMFSVQVQPCMCGR